jgi:hypothetical protein
MFWISPSLIKKFFYRGNEIEYCPRRIMDTYINPIHEDITTESMLNGKYFESLCIGSTRDGSVVTDLPRKQLTKRQIDENERYLSVGEQPIHIGEKTIDQVRIEQQSLVFKQLAKKYMMTIEPFNTQTEIRLKLNDEFGVEGHPDIFPTPLLSKKLGLIMAWFDLKLTLDLNSEFGNFCWGRPELMDHTQDQGYEYIIRNINTKDNEHLGDILIPSVLNMCHAGAIKGYYWVFSYSNKSMSNKPVPVNYDKHAENEIKELLRKTMSKIEYYDKLNWPTRPNYNVCLTCPLKKECNDYDEFNN